MLGRWPAVATGFCLAGIVCNLQFGAAAGALGATGATMATGAVWICHSIEIRSAAAHPEANRGSACFAVLGGFCLGGAVCNLSFGSGIAAAAAAVACLGISALALSRRTDAGLAHDIERS